MRLLITNNSLSVRAGTELVVFELAQALRARGHEVAAYSSELGDMAELVRHAHVSVVREPLACPFKPDIIHGQHHLDAMSALLSFPDSPAVFHSHGGLPWVERAPLHPRILHYIGMCPLVTQRMGIELGIPDERLHTVLNWVDLKRFTNTRLLPPKPQRALVYTRMLDEGFFLDQIRAAFAEKGISLDLPESLDKGGVRRAESLLPEYDIVLAAGRSALEAIACGCATMVTNHQSCLGFVTPENLADMRNLNMAPMRLSAQLTSESITQQLETYCPDKAATVTQELRASASLDQAVDTLLAVYQQTIDEWRSRPRPSLSEETQAAAAYLRYITPGLKALEQSQRKAERLESRAQTLKRDLAAVRRLAKESLPQLSMIKELRRSILGRLAMHLAKHRLNKPSED